MLAPALLGALAADRCEQGLLVLAALDQSFALEPLQHLAGRGPGDPEHLSHAGGQRGRPCGERTVFPDRESQEVDRLEVLVDGVALRHFTVIVTCKVTLTCARDKLSRSARSPG